MTAFNCYGNTVSFPVIENLNNGDLSNLNLVGFINNLIPVTLGNIVGGSFCWDGVLVYLRR